MYVCIWMNVFICIYMYMYTYRYTYIDSGHPHARLIGRALAQEGNAVVSYISIYLYLSISICTYRY